MLVLGPIIFGLIIGFIVGTRLKTNSKSDVKFTIPAYLVIFLVAIVCAWQLGQFPYYDDVPIATGFLSGAIGLFLGKLLFGRESNN